MHVCLTIDDIRTRINAQMLNTSRLMLIVIDVNIEIT